MSGATGNYLTWEDWSIMQSSPEAVQKLIATCASLPDAVIRLIGLLRSKPVIDYENIVRVLVPKAAEMPAIREDLNAFLRVHRAWIHAAATRPSPAQ